jgi:hypothetical protein
VSASAVDAHRRRAGEVSVPAYELFTWTEVLGRRSFVVIADDTRKRSEHTGAHR